MKESKRLIKKKNVQMVRNERFDRLGENEGIEGLKVSIIFTNIFFHSVDHLFTFIIISLHKSFNF